MTVSDVERRLAAILISDIEGYSRMMALDPEGTVRQIQEHRLTVIDPTIGQYHGRIVRMMGDGLLVEFQSVVDAVDCAVSIQHGIAKNNADQITENLLRYRMGINLGEIIVEGDDIHGDGINIAARLEQLAEPDSVCISSAVFSQVEGVTTHEFVDIGAHNFKNIAKPIRAYAHTVIPSKTLKPGTFRPFIDLQSEAEPEIVGGCLCGNIRYEITAPALGSMYCHCRMCQKFTGAPLMSGTIFNTSDVHISQGKAKYYQSSEIAERGFCSDCGTSLFYRGVFGQWADFLMVYTATLDHPEVCMPTYHLGIESTMPWLELHDDLPRTSCKDSPSLVAAYHFIGKEVP